MASYDSTIIEIYDRLAAQYIADRPNVPWDERPWLDKFIETIPSGGCVLDIGCGAGAPIGEFLLTHGRAVTGVDTSCQLIAHCKAQLPQGEWLLADMRSLSLNRQFHGLVAWDSFFHLNHDAQRAMFPIFEAHALPGAMLMFTSGPEHGEACGDYHGETLYHASLAPAEYEQLLARAKFSVVEYVAEDPDCAGHTVWLAKFMD